MLLEIVLLFVAFATLAAAVASILAARAACQSAVNARESALLAEKAQRRSLLRDLSIAANRVIAEALQISLLVEELKTEYRMLATASGQAGSSRERLLIQRAEAKHKEIAPLQEEATKIIADRVLLGTASEEETTELLSRFDGQLVQILRIKEGLAREVAATAGDNRIHREGRIKSIYRR
jgi:hypothetical protein